MDENFFQTFLNVVDSLLESDSCVDFGVEQTQMLYESWFVS